MWGMSSVEQLSQGVGPVIVQEPNLLDSFDKSLKLLFGAWEIARQRQEQVVDMLLAQATLLHKHHCITFNSLQTVLPKLLCRE